MKKTKRAASKKIGAPPGTLIYTGDKREDFEITVIDYDASEYKRIKVREADECFPFRDTPTVTWIDIVGLHRVDVIERIGKHYNLHP